MISYLIALPLVFLLLFPASLLSAYVLQVLWGWFVVPLGMQPLSFWLAFGLMTIVGHFRTWKPNRKEDETLSFAIKAACGAYLMPLLSWAWGYIAHQMMGG